jgi:hypothetical protein
MGVLQLITNIKHRKLRSFSSQPLPVYNQPFHTSSHFGGNNPLLVYASTMNPHHLNITKVHPLTVDTGMVPRTAGQEPTMHSPSLSPPTPKQYDQHSQWQTGASSSTDRDFTVHTPSPSLSVTSNHTDCSIDFTCVCSCKKYILNFYRFCHANSLKCINKWISILKIICFI